MGGAPRDNQDSLFGVPERLADLIVRDHDGDLSPAELDELGDLLKQSAQARDLYVRWGLQAHVLAEALRPEYDEGQSEGSSADLSAMGVVEASEEHYPALLAELNRMEAKAPAIAFPSIPIDAAAEQQDDAGSLSAHDLAAVGRYALRLALTSKPAKRFYAYAGAAAIVLLAAVGLNLWIGSEKKADTPFAGQQQAPQDPPQADVIHVATLTAEHHAQWAEGAFAPGSILRAGQTLTLTHGFAEITTRRGAVAILEAPCVVELTKSDNAIRLNTGKLVGICETPASRGFTVYSPDGRLIDTGTRFGVIHEGTTRVRVIEGEVVLTAKHADAATLSTPLAGGQTARIEADQSAVVVEPIEDLRFITQWGAIANAPRVEGAITFERAMTMALGANETEADRIKVYLEHSGLMLAENAVVTLTDPGVYDRYDDSFKRVSAGLAVDSYFVHLDPQGNENATTGFHATIQFDRPILGIIATGEHLAQSHETFGLAGVTYGSSNAVLSLEGKDPSGVEASASKPNQSDRIRISEDRRTLTLELYCGLAIDQFRVLVTSEQDSQ